MANKSYSAITVAGLGVGIAVCLVIFVFIRYQESYDQFHANRANIYRILTKGDKPDDQAMSSVPFPLPTALKNDFPDWKVTGIWSFDNLQVKTLDESGKTEKVFKEKDGGFCVDPAFFKIFDFPWLAGDPDKSLADRQSVVLSRSLAERYFGDWRKAVGRSIQVLGPKNVWKVTGVLADPPSNTDLKLNMVFPYAILNFDGNKDWWSLNSSHGCYVLLPPGVRPVTADRQLSAFSKKYRTPDNKNTQLVQSLANVHFDDKAGNFSGKTISPARIRNLWR